MTEPAPQLPVPEPSGDGDRLVPIEGGARSKREATKHYVMVRHRHNWQLLLRFCFVGGTGFIVNIAAFSIFLALFSSPTTVVIDLPFSDFNVRAYHVASTLAFLVANTSNYLLNRSWTFRSRGTAHWLREYVPFLLIGVAGQVLVLGILTVLLHGDSPVRIDNEVMAQAIAVIIVTPLSFIGNKVWTFKAVRASHKAHLDDAA
jgi:putative flippase GtrA